MINVFYDKELNVIVLEFAGTIDAAQGEELIATVQDVVPERAKGFRVLTDLSAVQGVDTGLSEPAKKLMIFFNQHGVKEVIRVIPDPSFDIGLNIMSIFHYSKDVSVITVQTRKEAQARLEES